MTGYSLKSCPPIQGTDVRGGHWSEIEENLTDKISALTGCRSESPQFDFVIGWNFFPWTDRHRGSLKKNEVPGVSLGGKRRQWGQALEFLPQMWRLCNFTSQQHARAVTHREQKEVVVKCLRILSTFCMNRSCFNHALFHFCIFLAFNVPGNWLWIYRLNLTLPHIILLNSLYQLTTLSASSKSTSVYQV